MSAKSKIIQIEMVKRKRKEKTFYNKKNWFDSLRGSVSKKIADLAYEVNNLFNEIKKAGYRWWFKLTLAERVAFTLKVKEYVDKGIDLQEAMKLAYRKRAWAITAKTITIIMAIIGVLLLARPSR